MEPPIDLGYRLIGKTEKLKIEHPVSFGGNVILYANEEISIGRCTMIAINSILHTTTHNHEMHPMWHQRIDRPIKIGRHVWIGVGSIILPGVIIEDYAVVAGGSVVAHNVPKGAIVGGNPARIIKYRNSYPDNDTIKTFYDAEIIRKGCLDQYCKNSSSL